MSEVILIECPVCRGKIASSVKTCIHCGYVMESDKVIDSNILKNQTEKADDSEKGINNGNAILKNELSEQFDESPMENEREQINEVIDDNNEEKEASLNESKPKKKSKKGRAVTFAVLTFFNVLLTFTTIVALVAVLIFGGIKIYNNNSIVGKWVLIGLDNTYFDFHRDKTMDGISEGRREIDGGWTYELEKDKLTITDEYGNESYYYDVEIDSGVMRMIFDDEILVFCRIDDSY